MNDKRPVNLALGTIQFPLPAIVSLLHRISGFALFGLIPVVLCAWQQSLASPEDFAALKDAALFKVGVIVLLAGLVYHLVAGIKHLFMDIGVGETLAGARALSAVTLVLSAALIVALGVWVWA
ncbi:MAG: succinate dehydrogenase, cytochrome b556 subunit [Pseudomonadota bacterium]